MAAKPSLIIYSGVGGEIVKTPVLSLKIPLLHAHAGLLPDYPGSTTGYYSLLERADCGVSLILLSSGIDTGDIVAQKVYPAPPPGLDIDNLYDASIRADLLMEGLTHWAQNGGFKNKVSQRSNARKPYFVIHPVLKHIAILSTNTSKTTKY